MTDEQRVRELLHDAVDDIVVTGDGWSDVEGRAAAGGASSARSLRPFLPVLAAAAAVLLIVGLVVVPDRDDENGTRVATPGPTSTNPRVTLTTAPYPPSTTIPPQPVVAPKPSGFLATREGSSKLVWVSAETGETTDVLHDVGDRVIQSIEYGELFAYYSLGPESVVGQMYEYRTSASKGAAVPRVLGNGLYPTRHSSTLAYALESKLVLRDVNTGEELVHELGVPDGSDGYSLDVEWLSHGGGLVVERPGGKWVTVDGVTGKQTELSKRRNLGEDWMDAAVRPDGSVAFITAAVGARDDYRAVTIVNAATGDVTGYFTLDQPVTRIEFDDTGEHMLFTGPGGKAYWQPWTEALPANGRASLTELASDISLADW